MGHPAPSTPTVSRCEQTYGNGHCQSLTLPTPYCKCDQSTGQLVDYNPNIQKVASPKQPEQYKKSPWHLPFKLPHFQDLSAVPVQVYLVNWAAKLINYSIQNIFWLGFWGFGAFTIHTKEDLSSSDQRKRKDFINNQCCVLLGFGGC